MHAPDLKFMKRTSMERRRTLQASKHFLNNPLIGNSIKISLRGVFAAAGSGKKAIRTRNNIISEQSASKVRSKVSSFELLPEIYSSFLESFKFCSVRCTYGAGIHKLRH